MDLNFTTEQKTFQAEVRAFIASQLDERVFRVTTGSLGGEVNRAFSLKMAERGWIGLTWPRKFGGLERGYVDKTILLEECLRVSAPIGYHFLTDRQVGPALITFGSEWQKEHFLPRIIRADEGMEFCLLFSEPNAGSDLANISTKAVRDGDDYIITGQKVWNTAAHHADFGWLLARTQLDRSIPGHAACSEFILDMSSPGVTVRPIMNIAGRHSFNEVFLDEVRVNSKYLVGTENGGFKQIMAQLDYERGGIDRLMQNYPVLEFIKGYVANMGREVAERHYDWAREEAARLEIDFNVGRLLCYQTAWMVDNKQKPSCQAALTKAFCTQFEQRLNDVASRIIGPASLIRTGDPLSVFDGNVAESYLWQPSYTLQGGSVEVLKNIVAKRGLDLGRR